jgi:tetratricopeptide (TPR) repeat protein
MICVWVKSTKDMGDGGGEHEHMRKFENATTKTLNGEQACRKPDALELLAKYFRSPQVMLTSLALTTAVLYSGTLFFQFVWDDGSQIVDNPLIRSWHGLSRVFVSDLWYHTARQQIYYRPLFVAWSILNYAVVGLRPWGWHLGAILLHLAATLVVFWLSRRLGIEYWTAALATLIFALHPIHIECVAWISAASDSMVTIFTALAFVAFLNARDPNGTRRFAWRLASLVLLACALLTKEMAISFTALVGAYIWLYPNGNESRLSEKLRKVLAGMVPYAVVTLCYVALRKFALWHAVYQFDVKHGYGDMAFTLPYVLAFYLRQLVLPLGLTGIYYTPYVTTQILSQFVLPVLILAIVAGLIYWWARKTDDWVIVFAGCWLLIGLAPALYLRNYGNGDFVRDRYVYLPSIGFAILAAKGIRLLPGVKEWSAVAVQVTAIAAVCIAYVGMSLPQQAYWDSDLLIYMRGHQLYPENAYSSICLGREYSRLGAHDRAIALVEDGVKRNPEGTYKIYGLAEVYIAAGRKDEGRKALEYALSLSPDFVESETGASTVSALWAQLGDYDRALDLCAKLLARDPNLYSGLYNCGNIEQMAGHYSESERLLQRAIEVSPQLAAPRYYLGRVLFLDGKNAEAQAYLSQAVAMDPSVYNYHYWLAVSLEGSGDKSAAHAEYQRTLQLNPDSKEAKMRLTALEAK